MDFREHFFTQKGQTITRNMELVPNKKARVYKVGLDFLLHKKCFTSLNSQRNLPPLKFSTKGFPFSPLTLVFHLAGVFGKIIAQTREISMN